MNDREGMRLVTLPTGTPWESMPSFLDESTVTDQVASHFMRRKRLTIPPEIKADLRRMIDERVDEILTARAERMAAAEKPWAAFFAACFSDAGEKLAEPAVTRFLLYGERIDRKPTDDEIREALDEAVERNLPYFKRAQEAAQQR